ncbi:MAG TPA: SIS domain-containing protein [Candidatus Dormibacteraeota bacterium]
MNGESMATEMAEQPHVLERLLERRAAITASVSALLPAHLCGTVLLARGSSDTAALYGRYLFEMASGRPVALASPSLHTLYEIPADHRGYLAVGISQSGRTPEVVSVLKRMRATGARTVAIVNTSDSPLGDVADVVIELSAGGEVAVPATKTFTATLVALALVATAMGPVPWTERDLTALPEHVGEVLDDRQGAVLIARRLDGADRVLTVARGPLLAAASETALKIRETSAIFAEAFSAADLRHGPIAAVTSDVPVLAFSAPGPAAADVAALCALLRERGVTVSVISSDRGADLGLPAVVPEALQPVAAAVRGQQIALSAALARRLDPDAPTGLTKVTLTR